MSPPDGSTTLTLNDTKAEEDRMRAALGLTPNAQPSPPADHNQRSGRDVVPVVSTGTRRLVGASDSLQARLVALQAELKTECGERVAAQQALADARQAIHQLQTKLAHTEMAATEALEAERTVRLAAEARLLAMTPAADPKPRPEKLAEPKKRGRPFKTPQAPEAAPKRRGRPPGKRLVVKEPKQKPVQWWLSSTRASKTNPAGSKH